MQKEERSCCGGGDTAMDCVRTSVRQKAKSVKCLYNVIEKICLVQQRGW